MQQFIEHIENNFLLSLQTNSKKKRNDFRQLKSIPFSKSKERFKYVDIKSFFSCRFIFPKNKTTIEKKRIEKDILIEASHSHIVFVDGIFSSSLSDLSGYQDAITIQKFCDEQIVDDKEEDVFALMNRALVKEELSIHIRNTNRSLPPLQILHVFASNKNNSTNIPRLHISLNAQIDVQIIHSYTSLDNTLSCWLNPYIDLSLERGARCDFYSVLFPQEKDWCFDTMRCHLKQGAHFHFINFSSGSLTQRNDVMIDSREPYTNVLVDGNCFLNEKKNFHSRVFINHGASNTISRQVCKTVVADNSVSSFDGMIFVPSNVKKIDSYQLNKNILLSEEAKTYSRPILSIFSDDVKVSHGVTCSKLGEEFLFYFASRGIKPFDARRLFLYGFFKETIDLVKIITLRDKINRKIDTYLGRFH